ncbi:MAG: hypothetical protein GX684_00480 [Ruminococcaceae bacterium]|nr:hypothetical protein [Oscillospiraceae bacterium]
MANEKILKFFDLKNTPILDLKLSEEYRNAEKLDRFRVGENNLFYRDGLKKRYIPLSEIDHAFSRVRSINTNVCCGKACINTFGLTLNCNGEEICEITSEHEDAVDDVLELMKKHNPQIRIGFKPAE